MYTDQEKGSNIVGAGLSPGPRRSRGRAAFVASGKTRREHPPERHLRPIPEVIPSNLAVHSAWDGANVSSHRVVRQRGGPQPPLPQQPGTETAAQHAAVLLPPTEPEGGKVPHKRTPPRHHGERPTRGDGA